MTIHLHFAAGLRNASRLPLPRRRGRARLLWFALLVSLVRPGLADVSRERAIAPGVEYRSLYRLQGPWAINVLAAELGHEFLQFSADLARGGVAGLETLSATAARESRPDRYAVGAVNGDYFLRGFTPYRGRPLGLMIHDGELISFPNPNRSVLLLGPNGQPRIEKVRATAWVTAGRRRRQIHGLNEKPSPNDLVLFTPRFGDTTATGPDVVELVLTGPPGRLQPGAWDAEVVALRTGGNSPLPPGSAVLAGTGPAAWFLQLLKVGEKINLRIDLQPDLAGVTEAIGGGPRLLRDRRVVEPRAEQFALSFAVDRHPRTAVGFNRERLFLVTVDGRQPGYSDGMNLWELANLMDELGCTDAMNLDGGGSTEMWVRRRVVSRPSDGYERAVGNALLIFSTAPPGPLQQLYLDPEELHLLAGQRFQFAARGEDRYNNPIELDKSAIAWTVSGGVGQIAGGELAAPATVAGTAAGQVTLSLGSVKTTSPVWVHNTPDIVSVVPSVLRLQPGEAWRLTIEARDAKGNEIFLDRNSVTWEADAAAGQIEPSGRLTAPPAPGRGTVTATVGQLHVIGQVIVGSRYQTVAGFEGPGKWSYFSWPENLPGAVEVVSDPVYAGAAALKLSYDFTTTTESRAAHARLDLPVGDAVSAGLYVWGDGGGRWLRARFRDAHGQPVVVDLAPQVNWRGWRRVWALLPAGTDKPLVWESVYLAAFRPEEASAGAIYLDDLQVETLMPAAAPAPGPG